MLATLILAAALSAGPDAPASLATQEHKPDAAVERAAREFRIEVYQTFRATREEYDVRRTLGNELLKAWNVEQPPRHREGVLAWFENALLRTRLGQPLEPYADLEDLKTKTVSEAWPWGAMDAAGGTAPDLKAASESLFHRIKSLWSPPAKPAEVEPASVEPAPEKTGD